VKFWSQWLQKSGLVLFMKEIIRNPARVGAAVPSSKYLANAMARQLKLPIGGLIVELGGGTGAVTSALLEQGVLPEQLIVIEQSDPLCKHLRHYFPKVTVIQGDALDVEVLLRNFQQPVNAVVSSLPLRLLSPEDSKKIGLAIEKILAPNGRYIQFTYSWRQDYPHLPPHLERLSSKYTWLNIPPARIDVFLLKGA
jgi:phosphatidylethanolamine/phosphatidyl-N-methylethanolamine N-methyltransferase